MSTASNSQPADCIKAIQNYLNKILRPKLKTKEIPGMKCLLLDKETKGIISMVSSMNDILSKEVYLVETLDAPHESVGHLKAICLIRPTNENVRELVNNLREPKFAEYHIFFTNVVPQEMLRKIADADHMSVVKQVHEYYADYYALDTDLFNVNIGGSLSLARPKMQYNAADEANIKRSVASLLSVLLSFKVKPYVRYLSSSDAAANIAREVTGIMGGERELFTFQRTAGSPLLLIMDRFEDPVTPLLTQWTYQAMVHDLIPGGIKNNRVSLKHVRGISQDLEEVVLSPVDDKFFHDNMHSNYGDLATSLQSILDDYTSAHKTHDSVSTIEDMQRFIEKYPELKSKGLAAGKHVAIMTEMSSEIEKRGLMDLSAVEQEVSSGGDNPNDHFRNVTEVLSNPGVDPIDALRLVMLYALRYERSRPEKVQELRQFVSTTVNMQGSMALVDELLRFGGASARTLDLFGNSGGMLNKLTSQVKKSVAGAQNVYTQHQPLVVSVLDQLARGQLSKNAFPFVGAEPPSVKYSTVIVFFVGGTTYEEATKVSLINSGQIPLGGAAQAQQGPPFRVILGGTTVHNTKSFLAELQRMGSVSIGFN